MMVRSYGRFQRSVQLPFAPRADQVQAHFQDGVLTLHIPKQAQQEQSRRIEVKSGSHAGTTPRVGDGQPQQQPQAMSQQASQPGQPAAMQGGQGSSGQAGGSGSSPTTH
jgi:HSP20 family protein